MSDATVASVYLISLWVTVSISFTLSAVGAALASFKPVEIQRISDGGFTEKQLDRLFKQREQVRWSIFAANTTTNIALIVCTAKLLTLQNHDFAWLNILFATPIILVLCEIFPRLLGARYRHLLTGNAVWLVSTFVLIMTPVHALYRGLFQIITKLTGLEVPQHSHELVEEQLLVILDKGTESGAVDQKEIELIESVFDFDDINVARIMTPRPDIYSLELSTPWRQVLLACQHSEWSRIPIFDGRSDNIVGVFLVKDLLKAEKESKGDKQSLLNLMLQPAFVPGSKTAEDMLNEFIERNNHMAFVVDEHGTLTGLVTMDDLLEQLVGDFDVHAQASEILKIRTNTFRVKASTDLDDFANEIGVNPTNSEHHSVGALVFHILGQMPTIGDSIEWQNYRFTVSTMDGRRIDEILVEQILSNKAAI